MKSRSAVRNPELFISSRALAVAFAHLAPPIIIRQRPRIPHQKSRKGQVILISLCTNAFCTVNIPGLWSSRTIWGRFGTSESDVFDTWRRCVEGGVEAGRWRGGASRRTAVRKRRAGEESALETPNTAARRAASTSCSATHRAPLSISEDSSRWR